MEPMGYILLAVIGFVALKAFGGSGSGVPSFPGNPASPVDPATGAKIINTTGLMPGFTSTPGISGAGPLQPGQTQGAAARIPATDIGGGKFWCPFPFTLYKDQADGKFYCYNEQSPVATQGSANSGTLIAPKAPIDTQGSPNSTTLIPPDETSWDASGWGSVAATVPASPIDTQSAPIDTTLVMPTPDFIQPQDINPSDPTLPGGMFLL